MASNPESEPPQEPPTDTGARHPLAGTTRSTGERSAPTGDSRGDIVLARAFLSRAAQLPAPALHDFVAAHGPVEAAHRIRSGTAPEQVSREAGPRDLLEVAVRDLRLAAQAGVRLLIPEDTDEWPAARFHTLGLAARHGLDYGGEPLALWVAGQPLTRQKQLRGEVAVVGARAATAYGEHVSSELCYDLANRDVGVVSGLGFGIDGAAHRGALAAGGYTVAVLPGGIDVPHPAGHERLLAEIREHGTVVSEYPPGYVPNRASFMSRNRILVALAEGTVVVEAGQRSGARTTAAITRALGRVLMAVPGPITSTVSVGCHEMLRTGGAVPVSSAQEVLESVAASRTGIASTTGITAASNDSDE